MARKNLHTFVRNGDWWVRVAGEDADRILASTQDEAIERARELARRQNAEVIVQRPDGELQARIWYRGGQVNEEFYLTDRIVVSRNICHGKPRIVGTRIMVQTILDLVASGKTAEEIVSDDYYPDLTIDDVLACVYFASHIIEASEFLHSDDNTSRPLYPSPLFKASTDMGV
jgi:uncharacterized protein (DUF433 family)